MSDAQFQTPSHEESHDLSLPRDDPRHCWHFNRGSYFNRTAQDQCCICGRTRSLELAEWRARLHPPKPSHDPGTESVALESPLGTIWGAQIESIISLIPPSVKISGGLESPWIFTDEHGKLNARFANYKDALSYAAHIHCKEKTKPLSQVAEEGLARWSRDYQERTEGTPVSPARTAPSLTQEQIEQSYLCGAYYRAVAELLAPEQRIDGGIRCGVPDKEPWILHENNARSIAFATFRHLIHYLAHAYCARKWDMVERGISDSMGQTKETNGTNEPPPPIS